MFRKPTDEILVTRAIGYQFKDKKLLLRALTRRSAINEGKQKAEIGDFQRLEFIGDAVLNLVIKDVVFENHPDWNEGQLTQCVAKFINNKGPLAKIARELNLGAYLIIGAGEEKQNSTRDNTKVLSDAFEALIGAVWLDCEKNFTFIRDFILKHYKAIGLTDFNKDYEEQVIKMIARDFASDFMSQVMPEIYEGSGGGGMAFYELLDHRKTKKRAHKPLTEFMAVLEKSLDAASDTMGSEDENVSVADEKLMATTSNTPDETAINPQYAVAIIESLTRAGLLTDSKPTPIDHIIAYVGTPQCK